MKIVIEIRGKDTDQLDVDELAGTIFNMLDDDGYDVSVSGGVIDD